MMKGSSKIFKALLIVAALQVSCMPTKYFQVFETRIEDSSVLKTEKVNFEADGLVFIYDLWSNKGDAGFQVKNVSDGDVIIDLTKTFYVRNDFATPYYSDGEISYSAGSSATVGTRNQSFYPFYSPYAFQANSAAVSSASSTTRTYKNPKQLIIPPNTYVEVKGFSIVNGYFGECDLKPYPSTKEAATFEYSEENAPLKFSNIVSYEMDGETHCVEHAFYISRITNLPSSQALKSVNIDECGNDLYPPQTVFAVGKPDSFYYEYERKP